jgi:hypothetical protein
MIEPNTTPSAPRPETRRIPAYIEQPGGIWFAVPKTNKQLECSEAGEFRAALSRTLIHLDAEWTEAHQWVDRVDWPGHNVYPPAVVECLDVGSRLYAALMAVNAPLYAGGSLLADWLQTRALTLMPDGQVVIEPGRGRDARWKAARRAWRAEQKARDETEKAEGRAEREERRAQRVQYIGHLSPLIGTSIELAGHAYKVRAVQAWGNAPTIALLLMRNRSS